MDVKRRVLAARLSVRINDNKEYSKTIGLSDQSRYIDELKGGEKNVSGDTISTVRSGVIL